MTFAMRVEMEVRRLRYFVAVAEALSFANAAQHRANNSPISQIHILRSSHVFTICVRRT